MCSFHQKNPSNNMKKLHIISDNIYVCPDCEKKAMQRVSGYCRMGDGIIMDNLERFHCLNCGSDFFDLSAMKTIRKFREKQEVKVMETV